MNIVLPSETGCDGDELHIIKNLLGHLSFCKSACLFNKPVSQGRLAMVYMSDNTKIPDFFLLFAGQFAPPLDIR
jgi:hypothetical protein